MVCLLITPRIHQQHVSCLSAHRPHNLPFLLLLLLLLLLLQCTDRSCTPPSSIHPPIPPPHYSQPMSRMEPSLPLLFLSICILFSLAVDGTTNSNDTQVLVGIYSNLQPQSALTGWTYSNPDPCAQSWRGVVCSGSSVIAINLAGLGLSGWMNTDFSKLNSLTSLDLSRNQISGSNFILPPNLQLLDIRYNRFQNTLLSAPTTTSSLVYLYAANNSFSGSISDDAFANFGNLAVLDLSYNALSGQLPQSFSRLYNLSSLSLQYNQFTGSINVLQNLPLQHLYIQHNQFTGWIPDSLKSIPDFVSDGNLFSTSPAPPPPPYTPPPPSPKRNTESSSNNNSSGVSGGIMAGIVIACILGVIVLVLIAAYFVVKRKADSSDEEKLQTSGLGSLALQSPQSETAANKSTTIVSAMLKPPPSEALKESINEKASKKETLRRGKSKISATSFSVADLQLATDSFSEDRIIGEGASGPVYQAKSPNGKLLAVKKIDKCSVQNDDDFLDIVSNISRLHHSNVVELIGYCAEHGQRLLVYKYFTRGSLYDMLHVVEASVKTEFTWNSRVKVALGVAKALEYLHEVCQPAAVHKNVKSSKILLDQELNPYLSDCGLDALSFGSESGVGQMEGSSGYHAPELTMSGVYTWQSDVYSFGVVMLELLTGRKALDSTRPRAEQSLVRWATPQLHDIDALANMIDPALEGMYPVKSLSRFADIITLCVQPEMGFRPPMSEVVQSLVRLMQRASVNKRRPGEDSDI